MYEITKANLPKYVFDILKLNWSLIAIPFPTYYDGDIGSPVVTQNRVIIYAEDQDRRNKSTTNRAGFNKFRFTIRITSSSLENIALMYGEIEDILLNWHVQANCDWFTPETLNPNTSQAKTESESVWYYNYFIMNKKRTLSVPT